MDRTQELMKLDGKLDAIGTNIARICGSARWDISQLDQRHDETAELVTAALGEIREAAIFAHQSAQMAYDVIGGKESCWIALALDTMRRQQHAILQTIAMLHEEIRCT